MRKEVLFAILIGAAIGLAIAFGVWRANKVFTPRKAGTGEAIPTTTPPKQEEIQTSQLVVTSPENNSVVSTNKVVIEGTAPPEAAVVITTNAAEVIVQAEKDGQFRQEIELEGGVNEVKVTAYDNDGNKSEQILMVVYSTELGEE